MLNLCCWIGISALTANFSLAETGASNDTANHPPPHTATYEVLRNGRKAGKIHVSLTRRDDGIWHYDTTTEATAFMARLLGLSADESAHFVWRGDKILPLTYHQVARGPTRNRFWQHRFDWETGYSETHTYEGDYDIELEPGVIDPLTLRLAVAHRLAEPDGRRDHAFRVLERDEIEDQKFFYQGTEILELDAGCFNTVKMQRFRREGSSRNYYSWHAAELHWLPARIVQLRDGEKSLDIRLLEWSMDNSAEFDTERCAADAD